MNLKPHYHHPDFCSECYEVITDDTILVIRKPEQQDEIIKKLKEGKYE